ncbi:MAG: 1-acyl-sn-glycerol-3-phosphate acyltransferase [Xanthobacteraceae bacterium]|nr:MAG: 1-acyl-sn-glycerol-3-phosphate acyltransferase [Xanthobacteraceae bacterium]
MLSETMTNLRSRVFDFLLGAWTGLFGALIPVLLLVDPRRVRAASRLWVSGALGLLRAVVGLGHVEIGRENRPAGPCLIVCNHQSTWETMALIKLFPDVVIVAKEELLRIPVFGWYLRKSPMITIDRELGTQAMRRMVEGAKLALGEGRQVLLFPEGTRKGPDEPISFKRGVELLYGRLDVPVLPVVVNSGRFWGIGGGPKRAGTISLSCLPTIPPGLKAGEMMARAEHAMEEERLRIG